MQEKRHRRAVVATGLIVLVGYFYAAWIGGMNPLVGGHTFRADFNQQYLSFFQLFRRVLLTGDWGQLAYSFHNTLGGAMVGNWSYYLLSPFNLLVLLFPVTAMPQALFVVIWLKVTTAGMALSWSFSRLLPQLRGLWLVLLGVSYAFSGYVLTYQVNLMWLDAVILLPLVFWALDQLWRIRRVASYIALLTLTIITNYYTAYMVALFLILVALTWSGQRLTSWRRLAADWGRFVGSSLIAGLLSAAVTVPTFFHLSTTKVLGSYYGPEPFELMKLAPMKLVLGFSDNHYPSFFIGTFALVAAVSYFGGCFSRQARAWSLLIPAVMGVSCFVPPVYLAWHAFQTPQAYPFRFLFLASFWGLWLGAQQLATGRWRRWPLGLTGAVLLGGLIQAVWIAVDPGKLHVAKWLLLVVPVLWLLLAWLGLRGGLRRNGATLVLGAVVLVELLINAGSSFNQLPRVPVQAYAPYMRHMNQLLAKLPVTPGFTRLEKNFNRGNDRGESYTFNTHSISSFSSNNDPQLANWLQQLGLQAYGYGNTDYGGTLLSDSLLGVRTYLTSKVNSQKGSDFYRYGSRQDVAQWPVVASHGQWQAHQNPDALPLGFAARIAPVYFDGQPMSNQTRLVNAMTGQPHQLFTQLPPPQVKAENVRFKQSTGLWTAKRIKAKRPARLKVTFTPKRGAVTYLQLTTLLQKQAKLRLAGQPVAMYSAYSGATNLGVIGTGKPITLTLTLKKAKLKAAAMTAFTLDVKAMHQALAPLQKAPWRLTAYKPTELSGTITVKRGQALVTSIPEEPGWQAIVDGRPARIKRAYGKLLAVPLSAGQHEVTLSYVMPGLRLGLTLSAVGGLLCLGLWALKRRTNLMEDKQS